MARLDVLSIKGSPVKCDVMKRKEEPNSVNERPTAPLVLIRVPGLVAKLAVHTPGEFIVG